jgi:putative tricarboxylic transport membrane protein
MKRGWQVACLAFLAVSLVWMLESLTFPLKDSLGPGPGFFPFWLSLLGVGLSAVLFVKVTGGGAADVSPDGVLPSRRGALQVVRVVAGLLGATLLLEPVGFRLTLLLFNAYLLVALGARTWWVVAAFAVAGSFGVFHVFYHWLKVPLPVGAFGI